MPAQISDKLLSWAPDADQLLLDQAGRLASLPFVQRVALMPDAHVGIGSSVGTVFATEKVIIPAAVGVDIGCGMIARQYAHNFERLGDLDQLRDNIMQVVPTGMGKAHAVSERDVRGCPQLQDAHHKFTSSQIGTLFNQFGTLGGGNHFIEVCSDEDGYVWVVIHSGSRGIGNQLAREHIEKAQEVTSVYMLDQLNEAIAKDKNLAYLVSGTSEFDAYVADMFWAQDYAWGNRLAMLRRVEQELAVSLKIGDMEVLLDQSFTVHCHHNYSAREHHGGKNYWITRKGAIRAREGDFGVVPGSMATGSYITTGLGNPASFMSSSHGAGRVLSRKKAKEQFNTDSLKAAMTTITWNDDYAEDILDEHPGAYKPLDAVMANQADLTKVAYHLLPLINVKGKS